MIKIGKNRFAPLKMEEISYILVTNNMQKCCVFTGLEHSNLFPNETYQYSTNKAGLEHKCNKCIPKSMATLFSEIEMQII